MTVYQQIQTAIDYIENNLNNKLNCELISTTANMSVRSFYNYFWSITGYKYGIYVRKRRLSASLNLLRNTKKNILSIALEIGYETHESFTRAFTNEFNVTPTNYRKSAQFLNELKPIKIIKEMYMGIIVKEIKSSKIVSYVGFSPDPEEKAHDRIWKWAVDNAYGDLYGNKNIKPFRNFGHDTDENGYGYSNNENYDNYGYKVIMTVSDDVTQVDDDLKLEVFEKGTFVVTGVEGNPEKDWSFIPEGWNKLEKMIQDKGYKRKDNGRCFEEKLEPSSPELLRLDLYIEIDKE